MEMYKRWLSNKELQEAHDGNELIGGGRWNDFNARRNGKDASD